MGILTDLLTDPARRRAMAAEVAALIDAQVAGQGGLAGMALKAAFTMVRAVKPGIVAETAEGLLPAFAQALDPLLSRRPEGMPWPSYFAAEAQGVLGALLSVTDERARRTSHQTLVKVYEKLRPAAEKHLTTALPAMAQLVERYVPALGRTG